MVKERPSYQQFWRRVTEDGRRPCALAGVACYRCKGFGVRPARVGFPAGSCSRCSGTGKLPCGGPLDAHHYVPKRRLQSEAAKLDVRNGVPLCRAHHEAVEQGLVAAPKPKLLAFFLVEHDVSQGSVPR